MAINCNASALPSVVACFQSCVPENVHLALQNYLWCQIANTRKFGATFALPLLTGFSLVPGATGTSAIAVWAAPPAGATATELWTSLDNVTFTLDSTNPVPSVGNATTAPAVGSFKWAKARYVGTGFTPGPFCASQEVSGRVCDWAARVIANGAAATSLTTRTAMNTFDLALVAAGIDSTMKTVNTVVPDSMIAAFTPLYHGNSNDPWGSDVAFGLIGAACLTVNGYNGTADTGNHYQQPSTIPNNIPSFGLGNAGLTTYAFTLNGESGTSGQCGVLDNGGRRFQIDANDTAGPGSTAFIINAFDGSVCNSGAGTSKGAGFYSMNRTGVSIMDVYFANSTNPFATFLSNHVGANVTGPPIFGLLFAGYDNNGALGASNNRYSYFSIHDGHTSAQAQAEFNAVDAFRIAVGGGRV